VPLGESNDELVTSYAEAIRTLRNSIVLSDFDRRLQSIMITSAVPGEGKTTVALHLAIAHARQDRTLLIDADLRRPNIHSRLGLTSHTGLNEVLLGDTSWREALQTVGGCPNLDFLPAGSVSRSAADLVGYGLLAFLEEAALSYGTIILDTPPLLGFAESLQLATAVDGVVVVTRAGQTNCKAVADVLNILNRLRANTVGLVLNEVSRESAYSYYGYGYYRRPSRIGNGRYGEETCAPQ
jgi:capsular exopolysaccharide synthesis family protein